MQFVKCKNNEEKLLAIRDFCQKQIEKNIYQINCFEADRCSVLDYAEEIHICRLENEKFETIMMIIDANPITSVAIYP